MSRRQPILLSSGAALVTALAVAWWVAPAAALRPIDRAFRDLPPGLSASHGAIEHAGAGLQIADVSLVASGGGPVILHADLVRVEPALAWPPAALELDGVTVSSAGLAAFGRAAEGSPTFYESARTFAKRQYGNFRAMRPGVRVRGFALETARGTIPIAEGRGTLAFDGPLHARLRVESDDVTLSFGLDASQDAATLRARATGGDRDDWTFTARIPAPGWRGF